MGKLKIGIIGCGVIGGEIAKACIERLGNRAELCALCDEDSAKAESLAKALGLKAPVLKMDELIGKADLVVEAASAKISADVLAKAIEKKKDLLIMSVGGLLGREELLQKAEESAVNVYIPSGAIAGLDGLKSASVGRLGKVRITTTKPPKGLAGAPYIEERKIDLSKISRKTVVFEGNAIEAVKAFPANINVSASLSLAGIGGRETLVRIVADPAVSRNIHEIEIEGEAGTIYTRTENVPSSVNPKTSALAMLSAIATIEGITKSVRIGT